MNNNIDISIVCPCFNEESVIDLFYPKIKSVLEQTQKSYEIIFINDGSRDSTLDVLLKLKSNQPAVRILNLSRNFGKESALSAGLAYSRGEVVIPIDVDMQDPPELILDLLNKWREGFDVVLAKRVDRSSDSFMKQFTARAFYKFHNMISNIAIPNNVGDFRLMSKRVVQTLNQFPENQRFMKGLFAWAGYKTATVEYKRAPRASGTPSFNGWKLWNLALDGFTNFSTAPLRFWLYCGTLISLASFIFGAYTVIRTLMYGRDWPGYASLLTVILFSSGVQLIGIGILGEYIGRIFNESKRRPIYIVEQEY